MDNIKIINEERFLLVTQELAKDDHFFVEKIFTMYLDRSSDIIIAIEQYIELKEFKSVVNQLHSLRGISAVLGLELISDFVLTLEKRIKSENFDQKIVEVEKLKQIRIATIEEMSKRIFI